MSDTIALKLDKDQIIETYEALCSLPFTRSSIGDCEPATKREPGIEQILDQLEAYIIDED